MKNYSEKTMANPYAEFLTRIENAYGLYNPVHKAELVVYLPAKVPATELDKLYWKLREEYSAAYKTPPDITQINNVLKQDTNLEAEASRWFDTLTRTGNSLDHVIISDVRAQEAVQSFGGWPAFCQRKPEDEHWHRKNFIDAYMKAVPGENVPQMLFGESTRRDKTPLMFGDRDLCAAALEYHKGEAMNLITDMTKEMKSNARIS